jgi:DNA gyrase subunit B
MRQWEAIAIIVVDINEDGSIITVEDNGRGIPVGIHKKKGFRH